ncbi:pseudouridine synthase [Sphingomonadaceae bacterium jetA1]|jgi:23S rRNA pseudouridine2605 synthase|uniref:pseudouridine synthase n=1 Tax=Facivitalis istanbulensis TaxID=3075838 RepID=UPI0034798AA8
MTSEQRIAKLLARAGVASRREIERMIAEGRIALNGVALDTPATLLTSLDGVTVDGKPVAAPEPTRLFLYHKPNGLLVTERDPKGRTTIYDRLPADLPRVVPVGRLDLNTEGLLLLTTDGGFKRQLELPATGVERTYRARAYGDVTQAQLEELIHGVEIDGIRYGQIDANLERRTGANVWIEMSLREGKNREVRRVLEYLGLQVSRLIRLRYGPFVLDELPVGEVGEVKGSAIVEFRRTLAGGIPDDAIRPTPKPGFRTPPSGERPVRASRDGAPRPGPDRSATGRGAERGAPDRTVRREERGERGARPARSEGRPFGDRQDGRGRGRFDAKPVSDRDTRPAGPRDTAAGAADGGRDRPRFDARAERPRGSAGPDRRNDRSGDRSGDRPARPSRPARPGTPRSDRFTPSERPTRPGGGKPRRPGGPR